MPEVSAARCIACCRRGTASVELALALPVFVITFAAIFYMFQRAEKAHDALQRARACAWDFALHGCDADATSLCSDLPTHRGKAVANESSVLATLADIPLLGEAVDGLLGEPASADATFTFDAFMDSTRSFSGKTVRTLVCAPTAESLGERIKGALCDLAQQKMGVTIYGCS